MSQEEMIEFLKICLSRAGADAMITPREMLREYMTVLNILMQNPNANFEDVVGSAVTLKTDAEAEESAPHVEGDKKQFSLDEIDI